MPYELVKQTRDGYKVCKPDSDKCFSKKALPLARAKKQMAALYAKENEKRGRKLKSLETDPDSGNYTAVIPAGAMGPGSLPMSSTGNARSIANFISGATGMPATALLAQIPDAGSKMFGPIRVTSAKPGLTLRKKGARPDVGLRKGAGLFDWIKRTGSSVASAAKSGLSSLISNISTDTKPSTGELGDNFLKAQTKLFSPSGRDDEPGIPPGQVIQNFKPNPLMPDTQTLYEMNKASYANSTQDIKGYKLVDGTPTLKIYNKGNAMIVAVRGTADKRDILTDITIAAQDMQNMPRYKQDLAFLRQFQTQYPPNQYVYLLTGHSLGGAICDQLMRDGVGEQAITFNPAVQKNAYNSQNNKRIYQSEDPLYRMMGRYCRYNVEVRTGRQKGAVETLASYAPGAGVAYTALQAHSLDNYSGGMRCPICSLQDRPHLRTLKRPF